jgi:heme-degrading monooxygenase HmoA
MPTALANPGPPRGTYSRAMYARVITAEVGDGGFDGVVRLAEAQLPGAREQPGFSGYYLLTDADTGTVLVISLWETREQMVAVAGDRPSGIRDEGLAGTGLTSVALATFEVPVHAEAPTD